MRLRLFAPLLAIGTAVIAAGTSAQAATLEYVGTFSSNTNFLNLGVDFDPITPGVQNLPQFNPALGTLSSVFVELSGFASANANATVNSTDNQSNTSDLQLTAGAVITLDNPFPPPPGLVQIIPGTTSAVITVAEGGNTNFGGVLVTPVAVSNALLNTPAGIAPYVGLGTIAYTADALSTTSISTTGTTSITQSSTTTATGTVRVIYTFNAVTVPEPGSFALAAGPVALVGLGVVRRRRKKA